MMLMLLLVMGSGLLLRLLMLRLSTLTSTRVGTGLSGGCSSSLITMSALHSIPIATRERSKDIRHHLAPLLLFLFAAAAAGNQDRASSFAER